MKRAACAFLTIALAFACAEAKPPFGGTIFVSGNILTAEDPTCFESLTPNGREKRRMFDRRRRGRPEVNAYMFTAKFDDGQTMIVEVNPEFGEKEAYRQAKKYLLVIGQMPFALRKDAKSVTIHKGRKGFGGGNRNLLIHTGMGESYIRQGILSETFYHEASHTSLDRTHARNKDWMAAQKKDGGYISGYAKHHPFREDVAESFLMYFAVRYKPGRIDAKLEKTIKDAMSNRMAYFDSLKLNMYPVEKTPEPDPNAKPKPPVKPDDLKRKIGKLNFAKTPLPEVFKKLTDMGKVNTSIHWLYLKTANVDKKTTVTLSLAGASLEKSLRSVLEKIAPGKLDYRIRKGVLVVSSREAMGTDTTTRTHDVKNLLKDSKKTTPAQQTQEIADRVKKAVDPPSWGARGGATGRIRVRSGRLVVTQNARNHKAVARFLKTLQGQTRR